MSTHSYCPKCDGALYPCTVREALEKKMYCPHCGKTIPANQYFGDALETLEARLTCLEQSLKGLI